MTWHDGPVAGFDLETTGPDPEAARIVTAAVLVRGDASDTTRTWLVNPGVPIPDEAAAVHGVTTERAQTEGTGWAQAIPEIAAGLAAAMAGRPLVVFNAPYDLTVLDRETRRLGVAPFADVLADRATAVIDPLVLDKHADRYRRGKRTLTAACEHYGVALEDAHAAEADALAAMRVAWKIGRAFPSLAALSRTEIHDLQVRAKAEQAASFEDYLRNQGSTERVDGSWPVHPWKGGAS